jgi:hypothetical protein
MRVSLDSNVWEEVFRSAAPEYLVIRNALAARGVEGFICEAAFRIEAIRKEERSSYFAQPKFSANGPGTVVTIDGKPHIHFSIGPDDKQHPGLPAVQADSLRLAVRAAHIAYRNDALCTNDRARATGSSVFDPDNRTLLTREFGVRFLTTAELAELLG